jgi:glycyl-tRNA synthetase beta chain
MAAATQSLLVELGTEELPVKALPGLSEAFLLGVRLGLEKRGIGFDKAQARSYYTPRRMAVLFPGVAARQPEQRSEVLGPYLNVGLDANGQPTAALKGFAQKNGIDWTELTRGSDAKGERFVHRAVKPGADTVVLLPDILAEAVKLMPIPKPMRWGAHEFAFARPLALAGAAVRAGGGEGRAVRNQGGSLHPRASLPSSGRGQAGRARRLCRGAARRARAGRPG